MLQTSAFGPVKEKNIKLLRGVNWPKMWAGLAFNIAVHMRSSTVIGCICGVNWPTFVSCSGLICGVVKCNIKAIKRQFKKS